LFGVVVWATLFALSCGETYDETLTVASDREAHGGNLDDTAVSEDAGRLNDTNNPNNTETSLNNQSDNAFAWPSSPVISIEDVYFLLGNHDADMLLVNVSDEEFYTMGHLEGSLKIPWDTVEDNLDLVDPARHVVLYCRRGVRSESAYQTLIKNTYQMVWVMSGGLEAWITAGYPTVPD
jgi:rhodanese-related sulfurtransferase